MASNQFELIAQKREPKGSATAKRLRREKNLVPAIIYGADLSPEPITLNHDEIIVALNNEAFYSHILTIKVDGKEQQAIIKDLQRHPYKRKVLHLDFLRIKAGEKITMNVPIHLTGEDECPGIKLQGGALTRHATEVEITCLPKDLPEFVNADISKLELDQVLHLSDMTLPKGVVIPALAQDGDHDAAIAAVHTPKAAAAEETAAPTAEEAAGDAGNASKPAGDEGKKAEE